MSNFQIATVSPNNFLSRSYRIFGGWQGRIRNNWRPRLNGSVNEIFVSEEIDEIV